MYKVDAIKTINNVEFAVGTNEASKTAVDFRAAKVDGAWIDIDSGRDITKGVNVAIVRYEENKKNNARKMDMKDYREMLDGKLSDEETPELFPGTLEALNNL